MSRKLTIIYTLCCILSIGGCTIMQNTANTTYPCRPINVIVPFGAGGGSDIQARLLEKFVLKHLNQPLVVLNKPGAAGALGWSELAHAEPDGYTLGITGIEVLLHTIYQPGKHHYLTSLDPIAQISTAPPVLVTNTSQPWQNINDLISYSKQHPKKLKYGHYGIGSMGHVLSEAFVQAADVEIGQVPFRSGSESIAALLGNHVQFAFLTPAIAKEHIKAGTLRAIATTGEKRLTDPFYADVPTLKELGFDIVLSNWIGVAAPKELPLKVKATLEEAFKKAIEEPEFKENMTKIGMEIDYLGNKDSRTKWVEEGEKLNKMLHDTGIINEVRTYQQ